MTAAIDDTTRYVIADEPDNVWLHAFCESRIECETRFVFDTRERRIVALQIRSDRKHPWVDAIPEETEKLEACLLWPYEPALQYPLEWGLLIGDEAPAWAANMTEHALEPEASFSM